MSQQNIPTPVPPAPTTEEEMISHMSAIRSLLSKLHLALLVCLLIGAGIAVIIWFKSNQVSCAINQHQQSIEKEASNIKTTVNDTIKDVGTIVIESAKVLKNSIEAEASKTRGQILSSRTAASKDIVNSSEKIITALSVLEDLKKNSIEDLEVAKRTEKAQQKAAEEARLKAEADTKAVTDLIKTINKPTPTDTPQTSSPQQSSGSGTQGASVISQPPATMREFPVKAKTFSHRTFSKEEIESGRVRFTDGVKVRARLYFKPGTLFFKDSIDVDCPLPEKLPYEATSARFTADVDFTVYLIEK
ncbi:MAG TPA: hypothetical protein VIR98_01795 [Candidatus Paceibacterota bacterium]|jgi:hypothetical protein